jgi:hypothetical protein
MIPAPQQAQPFSSPTMLQGIVDTICDRRHDTAEQRDARSRDVVGSVLGFASRDSLELMLAGMAVIHAHLIEDAARDLFRERDERLKARAKSALTGLDRVMMSFLREFRIARKRQLPANDAAAPAAEHAPEPAVEPVPEPTTAQSAARIIEEAKTRVEVTKPKPSPIPRAPRPPSRTEAPKPPVPLLPPILRSASSVATMLAVLSPPVTPKPASANGVQARAR